MLFYSGCSLTLFYGSGQQDAVPTSGVLFIIKTYNSDVLTYHVKDEGNFLTGASLDAYDSS